MNVYVETNFILEIGLLQEEHESCEKILDVCKSGNASILIPAFCLAESFETGIRQAEKRKRTAIQPLPAELQQLSRSEPYKDEIDRLVDEIDRLNAAVSGLLSRSVSEENQRLTAVLEQILAIAQVIPLDSNVIAGAIRFRSQYELKVPDAMVYSSVIHHLPSTVGQASCFIARDRHFSDPEILKSLMGYGCKVFYEKFTEGCEYVKRCANVR